MLISNVNGEMVGASMVKNSSFYIEIAKFVQAYNTIIKNPNEFLREVGQPEIKEKEEKLDWNKFVLIMQKCDLGFEKKPTESDLVVYYNYALEIGSLDSVEKRVASVAEVADAQKHYYNFIDEATDRAKNEYLKQHRIAESRAREMNAVDSQLMKLASVKSIAFIMQMIGVMFLTFGVVSFFVGNAIVNAIGGVFGFWKAQYLGAIVLLVVGFVLFLIFDKIFINFKRKHKKLKKATEMIFKRTDESIVEEKFLKRKLDELKSQLSVVQAEINDKKHRFDVKYNIDKLKSSNKYYQKLCENEEEYSLVGAEESVRAQAFVEDDYAPVKLSKEHSENLHTISKEAINLEGQFDEQAYNEKFEKSRIQEKKEPENNAEKQQDEEDLENLESQEKELLESIDYIKDILGFAGEDIVAKEDEKKEEEKALNDLNQQK